MILFSKYSMELNHILHLTRLSSKFFQVQQVRPQRGAAAAAADDARPAVVGAAELNRLRETYANRCYFII